VEDRQPTFDLLGEDQTMRLLLGIVTGAILLGGCTVSDPPQATDTSTPMPPATSPAAPTPAPPPSPDACYRLSYRDLGAQSAPERAVPCRTRHDAQTIHVGVLPATTSAAATGEHVTRVCRRRLSGFLNGDRETRRLSRFTVVWFGPTKSQLAAGASWFRCDVVAFSTDNHLLRLPRPAKLAGAMGRPDALATYGLCGSSAPGDPGFTRVICGRQHAWQAVATVGIGGTTYPSKDALSSAGQTICNDRARALAGNALQFRYGWEWPSRRQWRNGQHYGYCWAPSA
jgi:hypothetical protein